MNPLAGCRYDYEQPDQEALREEIVRREKEAHDRRIRLIRLKAEHGWLSLADVFDRGREVRPLAIYPPGREEQPIPIDRAPFAAWLEKGYRIEFMRYEAFKDAYLLALSDRSGTGKEYGALWWLYPDGRVEPLLTHRREGGWEHFFYYGMTPTRAGILAIDGNSSPRNGQRGLYRRASDGKPEMLDRGLVNLGGAELVHKVSPGGCKVAYGIDPRGYDGDGPRIYRLRIVDVCADIPK